MPWETTAGRSGLTHCRVQPPDAENRMSGGVGGSRRAIAATRPDRRQAVPACSGSTVKLDLGMWTAQELGRAMEPSGLPAPEALQQKK